MHLLAAQPGGFVEEEGIIDLGQNPAPIVILAAADTSLAMLVAAVARFHQDDVSLPATKPMVRLANWTYLQKPAAYDLYEDKVLEGAELVIVSLLGGASYWQYGFERLQAWQQAKTCRQLVLVPGDDAPDQQLQQASSVDKASYLRIWAYLRHGGVANGLSLLRYCAQTLWVDAVENAPTLWHEPVSLPNALLYLPTAQHATSVFLQASLTDWQQRSTQQGIAPDAPKILLLFYRSHLQSGNTAMFDDLLSAFEKAGMNPIALAVSSLKDTDAQALINHTIKSIDASLVISTLSFANNKVDAPDLSSAPTQYELAITKPIPVLQLVLSSTTQTAWQEYSQGLRSRDIAMQVVLPEMDGHVLTRAVSFRQLEAPDSRTQIGLTRYVLHPERAEFVAHLAARYCQLQTKPNTHKRIALILANYPTKDGRIGNGVGLDTPQSTVNILTAMQAVGYPVANMPNDGTALIQTLLEAVTNNPATLHYLPCWQSLSIVDYMGYFAQLPDVVQQQIQARWGDPTQDPKCRQGRLMIAGVRLGETFVGIQPARGYNMDLVANYHDPDLVPPHSYLAFYFWLRHQYQVDAIVHVGKHGNLEWLPGKGVALSETCYPDLVLGPMPHFYPFIVNDPGEGAQAKRRTQGVIIDHLMPPMARAEVYGDMAELEHLVDELYQATGLDIAREQWLRQQIVRKLSDSHLQEELGLANDLAPVSDSSVPNSPNSTGADSQHEEALLAQLDAYLCDIKESQIRNGLHILGALPEHDALAETLVALLRLPRGEAPHEQGILHNLSMDLGLGDYNPLKDVAEPWHGARPSMLADLVMPLSLDVSNGDIKGSDTEGTVTVHSAQWRTPAWRTEAHTRERLELLAVLLIQQYILPTPVESEHLLTANTINKNLFPDCIDHLAKVFPRTSKQLIYAKQTLLAALHTSVEQEIHALLDGLAGIRVAPGPSGAPTRGRLDTLPTGRNFFSLDNRSVPSPAAWALGQLAAESLIQRHLQEHGNYPKQLGISVWGTATMRTGGDDIAQAFALMGIEPVWAAGSQRVIDFTIVPAMQLGRPRVDVTLRVSGFFRDAFPNVMKLYDAAVQALADYPDSGTSNTIAHNIAQRQQQLVTQGMDATTAKRQASYRVYGSKPGAYGAGLQGLIDERCWEIASDLAEAYVNWGGYAYGNQQGDGVAAHREFAERLSHLEVVVQNQDNREHDLLDSDDYYQFQGGMANAISHFSSHNAGESRQPVVYHGDNSNPAAPKTRTLKEELNRVIRARVLNPKWINAMQQHGYKGAFEMAASVDYLFAYDATTGLIDDYQYQQVSDALIFDKQNQKFMQQHNPAALEEMTERMLEACQRGMWQAPQSTQQQLQDLLLALDQQQETAP